MRITYLFLMQSAAAITPHGRSYTKAQMQLIGLKHPLSKGWMHTLIGQDWDDDLAQKFYDARLVTKRKKD